MSQSQTVADTDARQRLIEAATEVFAQKGYAEASTREICRLAGANVAAIHYYFGDKASLYREIFRPARAVLQLPESWERPDTPLREALVHFYRHLLQFTYALPRAQFMRMLFVREQLQPTGVLSEGPTEILLPFHERVVQFATARCGASHADLALRQLAFGLVGLAMVLLVERSTVEQVAPGLLGEPAAVEATVQRLADSGVALFAAERARRTMGGAQS
jgi:AcrR family transcriptional regulator